MANYQLITEGFHILRDSMAPFIARELIGYYGEDEWWTEGVYGEFREYQRRDIPKRGTYAELTDSLDIANCLLLIDIHWRDIFSSVFTHDRRSVRSYLNELRDVRNDWAHFGGNLPSARDTRRALDTMSRLCSEIDPEAASEIDVLLDQVEQDAPASKKDYVPSVSSPKPSPKAWRLKAKSDWTEETLAGAINEWCSRNGRTLTVDLSTLSLMEMASLALVMFSVNEDDSLAFEDAPASVYFKISDRKLAEITSAGTASESATNTAGDVTEAPQQVEAAEDPENEAAADENIPEPVVLPETVAKADWSREDIIQAVHDWCDGTGRFLNPEFEKWSTSTLKQVCLKEAPDEGTVSTEDEEESTEYVLNDRQLMVITHR